MSDKRLIDANALHKRIEMNLRASNPFTIEECCYKDALNSVDEAPTIDPETLRPTWRNPETDPPKVEEDVLILFETACGGYGITTANYEDGTVLSQKSAFYWEEISEWGTYDKESDDYFIPKGWWEYRYFNQDDIYDNRVDAHVVGWMPLPKLPGERPKKLYWREKACTTICPVCGYECNDDYYLDKFCPGCGTRLWFNREEAEHDQPDM